MSTMQERLNEGDESDETAPSSDGGPTRRRVLEMALGGIAATVFSEHKVYAAGREKKKGLDTPVSRSEPTEKYEPTIPIGSALRKILESNGQRGIGGIAAGYFGLEQGAFPPGEIYPNFPDILASLWGKKQRQSPLEKQKMIKDQGVLQSRAYARERAQGTHRPMPLEKMREVFEAEIQGLRKSLDLEGWGKKIGISSHVGLLKQLDALISGRTLTAYALTELFPSNNGQLNVSLCDLLLRSAGANFLTRIPALYDEYLSFGPFQFTQYALFDTPGEKRGASQVAAFLNGKNIPGSVTKLVSLEHHADAAYLFALYGVSKLIKAAQTHPKILETLSENQLVGPIAIAQYIATAHHAPAPAKTAFLSWLAHGAQGRHSAHFPDTTPGKHLKEYALKTNANFTAL